MYSKPPKHFHSLIKSGRMWIHLLRVKVDNTLMLFFEYAPTFPWKREIFSPHTTHTFCVVGNSQQPYWRREWGNGENVGGELWRNMFNILSSDKALRWDGKSFFLWAQFFLSIRDCDLPKLRFFFYSTLACLPVPQVIAHNQNKEITKTLALKMLRSAESFLSKLSVPF